ncbi:MAG: putative 4-hydroxybenzoate polyprenyltransferase [Actinomycetia bacterium]|nr:putative 4-hydroxybenzoate polyprenyltransferase [Actinomycetes bacterium]
MTYLRRFAGLVKFEHSIFALPFAYSGAFLAEMRVPGFWRLFWITVALVAARSFGMALNRLIDAEIDARNPRTAGRELPTGRLKRWQVWAFALVSLGVLVGSTFALPVITRYLWPVVIVPMVVYPYTKRWTWLSHLVLGFTDGLAPIGAWIAVTGALAWEPFVLGAGVGLWIAGFDVIYAFMDIGVDREQGLHSIPADLGENAGLWSTRIHHAAAIILLGLTGYVQGTNFVYYLGVAVCAVLLFYENWLMRKADLEKVGVAFMTMNGVISVVFLFFTTLSLFVP